MPDSSAPDLIDRLARGWRAYALVALIGLCAGLPGIFRVPPLDRDESRFAQATAQMLERNDYVRIAVQDVPRNKKPIGIHWLQSASVAVFSSPEARAIWAYRLPSLAGAILAALACFWGGSVLVGRRAALIGAALLAASALLSTEAMIAKTDAALCGFTALALAALARVRAAYSLAGRNPEARRLGLKGLVSKSDAAAMPALVFWGAIAGGVLIKGPITPMVAGLCLLMLFFWERRARWMKPLAHPSGPIIAALIVLPWFIAIGQATNGQFFKEAVGGDMGRKVVSGDEGHDGPFGMHLLLLPILSFPIAVGLPAAARLFWRAIRAPRGDSDVDGYRFLIAWAAPTWLVFELLPTKLVHYPLPAYPALALLAGAGLTQLYAQNWKALRWGGAALFLLAGAVLTALCAYLSMYAPGGEAAGMRRAVQTALVVGGLMAIPLVVFAFARRPALGLSAALAAAFIFVFSARERILPESRVLFISQDASDALWRQNLHPRQHADGPRLIVVGYEEPSFIFLTRTDTLFARGNDAPRAATPGQAMIVEARERRTLEQSLAVRGWVFAPSGPAVAGLNYSNGDEINLQPGRIVAAPQMLSGFSSDGEEASEQAP